jgi:hypothetical protein
MLSSTRIADLDSLTETEIEQDGKHHEVIAPWPHMPSPVQSVQGTEQVLPTAMIRYMVGSWRDSLPPHERCPAWRPLPPITLNKRAFHR